ncbi:MAG TPA: RHS repeat-associated core domain-containing protein [Candidatus Limnocylindria bacterium]|nr:RHS repeat-associated core domain-containing protein [Candidatus Limnocylindria bacterium]
MKRIILAWAFLALAAFSRATEGPGWVMSKDPGPVTLPSNSRTIAHRLSTKTGGANCPGTVTPVTGQPVVSEAVTSEITSLANNLENDPVRIYDYVHNYIKYVHYFGSKKGALLTLLEGSGNDFDQCALLMSLLRAAAANAPTQNNYSLKYHFGLMQLPYQSTTDDNDLMHWLGVTVPGPSSGGSWTTYASMINSLNARRGYPKLGTYYTLFPDGDLNNMLFHRVWIKLSYPGGATYCLDPAFKPSVFTAGINLATATGLNVGDLLTQAEASPAAVDANSVKSLHWANISSKLTTYTANLLTDLQATHPNYSVDQVLGGYSIEQSVSSSFPGLPFAAFTATVTQGGTGYTVPVLEWDNIPAAYLSTMRMQIDSIDVTYYIPDLKARKVSLTFASSQAQISLDDTVDRTGTGGSGANATMTTSIAHPYGSWDFVNKVVTTLDHRADQTDNGRVYQRAANGYVMAYGFDDPNQWLTKRQQKLNALIRANGTGSPTTAMITETLNVIGLSWIQQTYMASGIIASQRDVLNTFHHRNGRVAQETGSQLGYYVDLPNNFVSYAWRNGYSSTADPSTDVFRVSSFPMSAHEHGVIEQLQNNNSASTVKCLYLANQNGQRIILGTPANSSAVSTLLNNETINPYTSTEKTALLAAVNTSGATVLLPSGKVDIGTTTPHWKGYGYAQLTVSGGGSSFLMAISGNYAGGFAGNQATVVPSYTDTGFYVNSPTIFDTAPPTQPTVTGADPVNMLDGSFTVNATDISVGQPEPRGFSFSRHYDTNRRYFNQANMANGWTHNYMINAAERSDTEAGMGGNTPQEAAAYIAAMKAALEVFTASDSHYSSVHWAVTALIAEWAVDQLRNNAVNITLGSDAVQFIKQPDNSYTAPAGVTMTLTKPGSAYILQQRHGNTFNFDATTKRLNTIVDVYGKTMTFTYDTSSGRLTSVKDCWNPSSPRTLSFTYNTATTPQLTSITATTGTDVAARTVSFGYTSGDLTSVTDPEGKIWSYVYDTDHKITQTKDPTLPTARIITQNTYDSDGKVTQQLSQGSSSKAWNLYVAGPVSVQKDPNGGRTLYYYDFKNRLVGSTDPNGNTSTSVYDGQDHVVKTYSPLGEMSQYDYDGKHNLTKVTDPLGKFSTLSYDSANNLQSKTDPRGKTTSYTYNSAFQILTATAPNVNDDIAMPSVITFAYNTSTDGTLASQTDQDGKVTSFLYDTYGQLTRKTYPISTDYEQFSNNTRGDTIQHIDARGTTINFEFNKRRQLTKTTVVRTSGNLINQLAYDDVGNLLSSTDGNGNTTTFSYSATQKQLTTTKPTLPSGTPVLQNTYDNRDWLQSAANALGQATTFAYDAGGRLISTSDPLSHTSTFAYDADGRRTSATSPLVAQVQTVGTGYNARGEQTSTVDAGGNTIGQSFDDSGNPTSTVNRNSGTFGSTYYGDNRIKTAQTPTGKVKTFTYNKRGLVASVTEPSTQQITFSYDDRGRLSAMTDPVGSSSYSYDKNNNLLTHSENSRTITRAYDELNRVTSYTDEAGNVIGYQYDNNGNLTRLTYPDSKQVNYVYDSNNRLTTVTDWASRVTSYTYDLAGRVTSVARPNGTTRNITYDADGRTTKISEVGPGGAQIALFKMTYDEANRMVNEFAAPLPSAFTEASQTVTYDADNRIATFNGATVTHDSDGNMTSGPLNSNTAVTHTFDSRNHLTGVAASGVAPALGYGYDSEGNRVGVTQAAQTTAYSINPASVSQVLVRTKADGSKTFYVYGLGLLYEVDNSGNTTSYHYDKRGSTIALSNGSGVVTDRAEYSAYGLITKRTGTTDTPFLFNGRFGVMTDANGLYYMRARYYNPFLRRFVNADPSGLAGGLNQYAYANGNPASLIDPFGLAAIGESGSSYWHDVGQTFLGEFDAVAGLVSGVANAVAHPIDTASALVNMAAHPLDSASALVGSIGNTFNDLTGPDPRAAGHAAGNILIAAASVAMPFAEAGEVAMASETLDAAQGGIQFGTKGDAFLANASNASSVEGMLDVAVHGNTVSVEVGDALVNHRVLARLIEQNPEFAGQEIRLLSCNTGSLPNGFAQNLANKLGVAVEAPNDIIWAYPDGTLTIGATAEANTGSFVRFLPGGHP